MSKTVILEDEVRAIANKPNSEINIKDAIAVLLYTAEQMRDRTETLEREVAILKIKEAAASGTLRE